MDQKKIDELFQKQLQNLETAPNKRVWSHIETKLKKKKRRMFPFWLFSTGVASIVVLVFFIFPFLKDENQNTKSNSDEIITITPKKTKNLEDKIDAIIINKNIKEEVLITKKDVRLKNQKNKENAVIAKKEKEVPIPKRLIKNLAPKPLKIQVNIASLQEKSIIEITKNIHTGLALKKIDITTFLKPKDSLKVDKKTSNHWAIAPVFAVLKSNSFSNTSPIDANLANSTKGENSFSYGVQVAYNINKKWTIQSGIHLQEMSFSNNQIAVFSSSQTNSASTEFISGASFSFHRNNYENAGISENSITNAISYNGNITQNYGYVEIPIELKYNLSNSEIFKTQIVTGFSSLLLNKNSIRLNADNLSTSGKASNLNTLNFSGNLGFDFNYLLNKNWSLHVNPMLKVQFNTFNENANNFAPFYLGIYSGLTYQF
ncbi:PorT family protein [Polaribacter litorisediminis]|uniref:PorT family protein n=1 Tax=Polaribacter litorisediminis TaxID=1908341 RepID=UPI001CBC6F24|nr:PorT family protein [Polaribacter litorisediminis]UAM98089.1 PorT family protein [Polaribacter litorisediminis]